MLTSSVTLSLRDINVRDPMQNPGQTQIFYKVGQTQLTWAKSDPVDPDYLNDPTRFQCWIQYLLKQLMNFLLLSLLHGWMYIARLLLLGSVVCSGIILPHFTLG